MVDFKKLCLQNICYRPLPELTLKDDTTADSPAMSPVGTIKAAMWCGSAITTTLLSLLLICGPQRAWGQAQGLRWLITVILQSTRGLMYIWWMQSPMHARRYDKSGESICSNHLGEHTHSFIFIYRIVCLNEGGDLATTEAWAFQGICLNQCCWLPWFPGL